MTIELWVFPAALTVIAFFTAMRTAIENTRNLGEDGLAVFARIVAWTISLSVASVVSATGWLFTVAIYLILMKVPQ